MLSKSYFLVKEVNSKLIKDHKSNDVTTCQYTACSRTLLATGSWLTGRKLDGSVGLPGFSLGIIIASFQRDGKV